MQDLLQAVFCRDDLYESLPSMSVGEEPVANVDVNLADDDSMCLHGWTQESFTSLFGILSTALPPEANLPKTYYEAKKIIHGLGLGYVKIHASPNDCMLFRDDMRWHDEGRTKDGKLRHPADGEAWRDFDARYPDFAADARNVRLGLASDGFNPFGNMSIKHSTWPVMLVPYNLPPWICMKQTSLLLSMIIPGPESPGNDIDIYLQPLIDELLELWVGVKTVDASSKKKFTLRAALLWTISDFPALAYLYGWSTSGRYGCPSCGPATKSFYLKKGKKMCYLGHRQWLLHEHIYRRQKRQFDGSTEAGTAPEKMSGTTVLKMLEEEVKLGGPVHYRWMYPMERFFVRLKAPVKNRAHPEGSIAEGYRLEECMTFCSRFLEGNTRFTRPSRNPEPSDKTKEMSLFDSAGEPIGKATNVNQFDSQLLIQAHRYVLRHCDELEEFR
ncbi:hypothetical protein U9M48_031177 [Paspalum notatum var. saurae]|uniref:DUF4218 domain-containing protein n=1 Tax=Paspalum notatum var. saurae TaxID=547442 RepID=A0AAQ3X444_PASNO